MATNTSRDIGVLEEDIWTPEADEVTLELYHAHSQPEGISSEAAELRLRFFQHAAIFAFSFEESEVLMKVWDRAMLPGLEQLMRSINE